MGACAIRTGVGEPAPGEAASAIVVVSAASGFAGVREAGAGVVRLADGCGLTWSVPGG